MAPNAVHWQDVYQISPAHRGDLTLAPRTEYQSGTRPSASFPARSLAAGESIELWVPLNEDLSEARSAAGALVLSAAPAWLAPYFEDNPQLAEFLANQQLGVHEVDGWLMLELR